MTYPRYFIAKSEYRKSGDFCYWSLDGKGNMDRHWNGKTERYGGTSWGGLFDGDFEELIEIQPSELALMI